MKKKFTAVLLFLTIISAVPVSATELESSQSLVPGSEVNDQDSDMGEVIILTNPTEEELLDAISRTGVVDITIDENGVMQFSADVVRALADRAVLLTYQIDFDNMEGNLRYVKGELYGPDITDKNGLDFSLEMNLDTSKMTGYAYDSNSMYLETPEHSAYAVDNSDYSLLYYTTVKNSDTWSLKTITAYRLADSWEKTYVYTPTIEDDTVALTMKSLAQGMTVTVFDQSSQLLTSNTSYIFQLKYESYMGGAGWNYYDGRWFYLDDRGCFAREWKQIKGKWYYFEGNGEMDTGWVKVKGKWYYLKDSGAMATGWVKVKGKWYYLNDSGAMATGWRKLKGKWYYLKDSGAMAIGWVKVKGKWYYLKASGAMAANTWVGKYYVNKSGVWTRTK